MPRVHTALTCKQGQDPIMCAFAPIICIRANLCECTSTLTHKLPSKSTRTELHICIAIVLYATSHTHIHKHPPPHTHTNVHLPWCTTTAYSENQDGTKPASSPPARTEPTSPSVPTFLPYASSHCLPLRSRHTSRGLDMSLGKDSGLRSGIEM